MSRQLYGVDLSRVSRRLTKEQIEAIRVRDLILARKLDVSIEDYLRAIGSKRI